MPLSWHSSPSTTILVIIIIITNPSFTFTAHLASPVPSKKGEMQNNSSFTSSSWGLSPGVSYPDINSVDLFLSFSDFSLFAFRFEPAKHSTFLSFQRGFSLVLGDERQNQYWNVICVRKLVVVGGFNALFLLNFKRGIYSWFGWNVRCVKFAFVKDCKSLQ